MARLRGLLAQGISKFVKNIIVIPTDESVFYVSNNEQVFPPAIHENKSAQ
jgi:hypothetical protein